MQWCRIRDGDRRYEPQGWLYPQALEQSALLAFAARQHPPAATSIAPA